MAILRPMTQLEKEQIDQEHFREAIDAIMSRATKNEDGSYDVEGMVDLSFLNLKELPLKFNKVNGPFYCTGNKLTTLKGCPKYVNGLFSCSKNELTSLEGCPKEVKYDFFCWNNKVEFTEEDVKKYCNIIGIIPTTKLIPEYR